MEVSEEKEISKEKLRNLLKNFNDKYQIHATISTNGLKETGDKVVYMDDLEKRKEAYGVCGECNEPGTGQLWCQPCNAKRFKENFKNWTSGNKDINELIQQSQLNAVHFTKCLEWIPFEKFQDVTYITRGGFGKIYSADWPEGYIYSWDIINQNWRRYSNEQVALKSLNYPSFADYLNGIKSHLQIYSNDIVKCHGITQNPDTKDYMMVLYYCKDGNLRNYLNQSDTKSYESKIWSLSAIARGLLDIHNAEKVHKDFHSGNILFNNEQPYISDLEMCQPANNEQPFKKEGVYGVLPYVAPEVLRGYQYTKAADIYSFGIIMNELMSEETPYNNIPYDDVLAIKICEEFRPKISEDTPKLLADLIMKCWDAKAENRPTTRELFQILNKLNNKKMDNNSEIYSQIKECEKIREIKLKNNPTENKFQTHPQAIYTSRLLDFKNLPEPVNSSDLSSFQPNPDAIPSTSANPISECLDIQLSESELNEINLEEDKEDDEHNKGNSLEEPIFIFH